MITLALRATLEAKPDKAEEVAEFLRGALDIVRSESGTVTWYALRFGETTFGIFDTFENEDGRQAHLNGEVAAALMARADELLAEAPTIDRVEVLAAK